MLQLQVIYGKDAGKCVRFHQSIVHIGSDPGNDFQLNDAESSQYHGEITCNHEANHYAYRDLQSDRGTRVRSANIDVMLYSHQMAQSVAIAGECMLHIGQSTLRCTYFPSPENIVPDTVQCVSSLPLHSLPPTNDPDLLSFLLDTTTTLTSKTTYQAVLKHLVIKLEQRIEKATHLAIWRYDSCRDSFSCVMERSRVNQSAPSILTEDDYREAIRMRTVSLFRSNDVTFPGCAVVAPLISSKHELGVLTVDSSDSNGLQESDLEILSRVTVVSAHSLERTFINADLSEVFDGFIRSIIAVMDARDPASAGHSMRVARYAMMTAQAIHSSTRKAFKNITFSSNHLDEIRFASLLHDIGKVVLRREILLKAAKLTQDDLKHLLERIDLFAAWFATQSAETMGSSYRTPQQFEHYREMVTRVQQAQAKATEDDRQLIDEMTQTFITPCPHLPLLTSQEKESLLIEHGTLNAEERQEIERHVLISWQYLSQIAWPQRWANVPIFVLQHHEKLNGTGYPYGISGDQIVLQSRIITVCDIFDALTGGDRSYKTRHSFGDAAQILQEEAHSGALDADIVDLFVSEVIPQISDPEGSIGI